MATGVSDIRAMGDRNVQHRALNHAELLNSSQAPIPEACKNDNVDQCLKAVCEGYNSKLRDIYSDNGGAGNILGHLVSTLNVRASGHLGSYGLYGVADYFHKAICEDLPPPGGSVVLVADPVRVPAAGCSKANVADARSWVFVLGGFVAIAGIRIVTLVRPQVSPQTLPLINAIYIWMGWADQVVPRADLMVDGGA